MSQACGYRNRTYYNDNIILTIHFHLYIVIRILDRCMSIERKKERKKEGERISFTKMLYRIRTSLLLTKDEDGGNLRTFTYVRVACMERVRAEHHSFSQYLCVRTYQPRFYFTVIFLFYILL